MNTRSYPSFYVGMKLYILPKWKSRCWRGLGTSTEDSERTAKGGMEEGEGK